MPLTSGAANQRFDHWMKWRLVFTEREEI